MSTVRQPDLADRPTLSCPAAGRVALLVGILVIAALALLPLRPPPASEDAGDGFSTQRALEHVEAIARAPRPIGADEHARVRRYLSRELAEAGATTRVQESLVVDPRDGDSADLYRVHNVLGRLPGRASDGALMLAAHYDSVPAGPGAADNAAALGAILESLRVLSSGPPLRNDVVVAFTDAEETGLAGARAFVDEHPWADDVGLVMNFEARGTRGPSILFETGKDALPLMRRYAAAARHPLAASYSYDVYRLLPNDTDFSAFRRAGMRGFNFAFIGGVTAYHNDLDRVENLDPRSLRHHGSHALSLARHFGDVDLGALPRAGEAIYFNLPLVGLVLYPASWSLPFAVALLVAALLCAFLVARRAAGVGAVLVGVLALPVALVAAGVVGWVVQTVLELLLWTPEELLGSALYPAALIGLGAAVVWRLSTSFARRTGLPALAAGVAVAWSVLGLLFAVYLPSTSYLLAWPLLFLVAALGWWLLRRRGACAALGAALLPTLLLWVPTVVLLATALGSRLVWLVVVLAGLPLAVSMPQMALLAGAVRKGEAEGGRWPVPAMLSALALVLLVATAVTAGYGPDRPRADSLVYVLDAESGEAEWASFDRSPDAWTSRWLGEDGEVRTLDDVFEGGARELLAADAPLVELPAPEVRVISEEPSDDGGRRLHLAVEPRRPTAVVRVALRCEAPLETLSVDGRDIPAEDADGERSVVFWGVPEEGFEIEVEVPAGRSLGVTAVGISLGFPEALGVEPRDPGFTPSRWAPTDVTLVRGFHDL